MDDDVSLPSRVVGRARTPRERHGHPANRQEPGRSVVVGDPALRPSKGRGARRRRRGLRRIRAPRQPAPPRRRERRARAHVLHAGQLRPGGHAQRPDSAADDVRNDVPVVLPTAGGQRPVRDQWMLHAVRPLLRRDVRPHRSRYREPPRDDELQPGRRDLRAVHHRTVVDTDRLDEPEPHVRRVDVEPVHRRPHADAARRQRPRQRRRRGRERQLSWRHQPRPAELQQGR